MNEQPPKTRPSESGGVFGNLPSQRPGVRSPRRERDRQSTGSTAAEGRSAKRSPGAAGKPAAKAKPPPPPAEGQPPARPRPQTPPSRTPSAPPPHAGEAEASGRGVEHLAWAGITVAAEAATLGVRLLSRAVEAVRERR